MCYHCDQIQLKQKIVNFKHSLLYIMEMLFDVHLVMRTQELLFNPIKKEGHIILSMSVSISICHNYM